MLTSSGLGWPSAGYKQTQQASRGLQILNSDRVSFLRGNAGHLPLQQVTTSNTASLKGNITTGSLPIVMGFV